MTEAETPLDKLRREIDDIDDAIHDLLMRRTALIRPVRDAKAGDDTSYYRPAREAEILRRIVARHRGAFPKPVLVRIWREITSALVRLQGPFSVAVYAPVDQHWYWDHAREHFGVSVSMSGHQSARAVVVAVDDGTASVGVLAVPEEGEPDPWWPSLTALRDDRPRIVARIPFGAGGSGHSDTGGALVIGRMRQEPTGSDCSYIVVRASNAVSRARLTATLKAAGLNPLYMLTRPDDGDPSLTLFLAEISDFVAEDDARIAALLEAENPLPESITVLGGYATPFTAADLESDAGKTPGRRP